MPLGSVIFSDGVEHLWVEVRPVERHTARGGSVLS